MVTVYELFFAHYGVRVFSTCPHLFGVTELPRNCVIVRGQQLIVVGNPTPDETQAAMAFVGFRAEIYRYPPGQAMRGLYVDIAA